MKILYVGNIKNLEQNSTKHWISIKNKFPNSSAIDLSDLGLRRWWYKYFGIDLINKDKLSIAKDRVIGGVASYKPTVIWFEKPLLITAKTLIEIKRMLPLVTLVCRQDDNPFGLRRNENGMWKHFVDAIPYYDLHFIKRQMDVDNFSKRGAKRTSFFYTGFDANFFYPPVKEYPRKDLLFSFIGGNFDQRSKFFTDLIKLLNTDKFFIAGQRWNRSPLFFRFRESVMNGWIAESQMSEIYQRSHACIGLFSTSNHDEFTGRAFQVAASGGVLLAPRSTMHSLLFEEGKEALFFDSVEECAEIILRLVNDLDFGVQIGKGAIERSKTGGYSLDDRVEHALNEIAEISNEKIISSRN